MKNLTNISQIREFRRVWEEQLKSFWENDAFYAHTALDALSKGLKRIRKTVIPIRRYAADASVFVFVLIIGAYVLFPTVANADMEQERAHPDAATVALIIESMQNATKQHGALPSSEDAEPRQTYTIPMTAYTSDVAQTDDTPCITASGLDVCERNIENVVAANFLPLGTRLRIPELYGDRVFYVEDRMNARYYKKMDIWMKNYDDAINFGLKYATIEVF